MRALHTVVLGIIAAAPAMAADLPDSSERFREAMSICTLSGPDIAPRLDRLAATGWTAETPDAADAAAFRDAALLDAAPEPTPDAWANARASGPVALPATVYRHGPARLFLTADPLSCRLATVNSTDSDLLFEDLAKAGAVTETGPIRHSVMATAVFDTPGGPWRTEVTLSSADTAAANALAGEPLHATLAVSFVTRAAP